MEEQLSYDKVIALVGVFATILGVVVTWVFSKRQFELKKLAYELDIEKLVKSNDLDLSLDLKVFYKGEELPDPTLMTLIIANTGRTAIENANIVVKLPGATYLIPGHFVDIPAGYDSLWDIERTDAEECTIKFKHINPRQVAKVRLLMDEMPSGNPSIVCPMPNVELTRAKSTIGIRSAEVFVSFVAPQILDVLRAR